MRFAGQADRLGDSVIDFIALIGQLCDCPKRLGVCKRQIAGLDTIGPFLERLGAFSPRLAHFVHQSSMNLGRAGMAWMTAVPSSSVTTDLQRRRCLGRAYEHRHGRVVRLEGSPVMSYRVQHVLVCDTVLACAGLDVHSQKILTSQANRQQKLTMLVTGRWRPGLSRDLVTSDADHRVQSPEAAQGLRIVT